MRYIFLILALIWASPATAEILTVNSDECSNIMKHVPDDDVAYKPGVDADGAAVEPADINAQPIELPQTISIPITFDFAARTPTTPHPPSYTAIGQLRQETTVATLDMDTKTGQLSYQGKILADSSQHALIEACSKMLKNKN